ncbi:MAG: FG-GAP repeat protein [Opitutaceae bacterium]|jgi:hypothetical protein|nr:FG-GAP repeat protein [Opitutaceae bacterium]
MKLHTVFALAIAVAATLAPPLSPSARATLLTAPDGKADDFFGDAVSASGPDALVGAYNNGGEKAWSGAAYYYKGPGSADGSNPTLQTVKLLPSDSAMFDAFSYSAVSLSGTDALIGADYTKGNANNSGAAYYYKALDQENGPTTTETVKLYASDGASNDCFGVSVSLSETDALVGAYGKTNFKGAAYYYKLAPAPEKGTTTKETVKLEATDGEANDQFGWSVSLSAAGAGAGANALVGAFGKTGNRGAAYYYKLAPDPEEGTTTKETLKLEATGGGAANDQFGWSVSLSADNALIGARGSSNGSGAAYYYKGLDSVTETDKPVNETVKLLPTDGTTSARFGQSVSLSGANALVGTFNGSGAYYYQELDTKTGTTTETVKLLPTGGAQGNKFGYSLSLSGDRFVIGAHDPSGSASGKAWAGDIRAFTTLDAGDANGDGTGTALKTDGLSFVSQTDWIIGATTAINGVILSPGDTATVTAAGKAVYIGQTAGADNNGLQIEGTLTATDVYVGAAGNEGNWLQIAGTADWSAVGTLHIAVGNSVTSNFSPTTILSTQTVEFALGASGENGEFISDGFRFGGTLSLVAGDGFAASDGAGWDLFAARSFGGAFDTLDFFDPGAEYEWQTDRLYTEGVVYLRSLTPVPEPAAWAVFAGLALLAFAVAMRRLRDNRV